MKHCKGDCGKPLGLLQGDYCKECYNRLPLRKKIVHDIKFKMDYKF